MFKLNQIYLLIVTFTFLTVFNCKSQNLIRNGSFESYHTPVNWNAWGGDYIGYYTWPPDTVIIDWKQYGSPDLFLSACPHTYSGVPKNLFGNSYAKGGINYSGFIAYVRGSGLKEYIYQKLSQPLQSGKIYCLSFFVSKADGIPYAIKSVGALFSNSTQPVVNGSEINATPQVVNTGGFLSDTTLWTEIQGCFTANGGEQYITIGNFTLNSVTDTLNVGSNNPTVNGEAESYYYIDNITLIDQTTVGIKSIDSSNDFEIYPNPTTGLINVGKRYSQGDYSVKILDLFGKEIINEVLNDTIDISALDKGVYTFLLYKNKQLVVTTKVMKD